MRARPHVIVRDGLGPQPCVSASIRRALRQAAVYVGAPSPILPFYQRDRGDARLRISLGRVGPDRPEGDAE